MSRARPRPTRRQTLASRRKERTDRMVKIGLLALGALILLILGIGTYQVAIAKPKEPIALVNGASITTRDYQAMVRYNRLNLEAQLEALSTQMAMLDPEEEESAFLRQFLEQQSQGLISSAMFLPSQTLEDMIDDVLVRQEAQRRGLEVGDDELERHTQAFFGYDPNHTEGEASSEPTPAADSGPTPVPLPTPAPLTLEAYQSLRQDFLRYIRQEAGISEATFQQMMRTELLRGKLQAALAEEVPRSAPQVHLRQVLVSTQDEAETVLSRLQAGEPER